MLWDLCPNSKSLGSEGFRADELTELGEARRIMASLCLTAGQSWSNSGIKLLLGTFWSTIYSSRNFPKPLRKPWESLPLQPVQSQCGCWKHSAGVLKWSNLLGTGTQTPGIWCWPWTARLQAAIEKLKQFVLLILLEEGDRVFFKKKIETVFPILQNHTGTLSYGKCISIKLIKTHSMAR